MVCCSGVCFQPVWGEVSHLPRALWEPTATQTFCSYLELLQRLPVKVIYKTKTVQVFFFKGKYKTFNNKSWGCGESDLSAFVMLEHAEGFASLGYPPTPLANVFLLAVLMPCTLSLLLI